MAEETKKDKKKKSKYQTKSFKQLNKKEKESFYNNVKNLKEFANKTKKQVYKILSTIKTAKDVTSPKKLVRMAYNKLRGPKPLFDPSDQILSKDGVVHMVNKPSKLKADKEAMKAIGSGQKIIRPEDVKINKKTGKLQEKLETGSVEKPGEPPVFDKGRGQNPYHSYRQGPGMNKGGRVRSYRGYGKARRG